MAKVLGALHSDQVKGSYSGMTFRMYRGMQTLSRKLRPVRRYRTVQPINRAIFGHLSRSWGLESDENRALWDFWASQHPIPNGFGGTFQLDGNQAYMMLNHSTIRLDGYAAQQSAPPLVLPPATIDTLVAVTGVGLAGDIDITITHLGTGIASDFNEYRIVGPFGGNSRRSVASRYVFNKTTAGNVLTATISDLFPGGGYWIRARYIADDGQPTNWAQDYAVAKA